MNNSPRKLVAKFVLGAACIVLGYAGYGQVQTRNDSPSRDARGLHQQPGASELAKENNLRVAASAAQIKTVLAEDAGLLVELKRWVAKDATDNGQVVEDADLSDDAIFDRLSRDLGFRSVATELLQRYGYLMPVSNPDSNLGKEQEFVLKERARRIVALEMQNDSSLPFAGGAAKSLDHTVNCDEAQDDRCELPATSQRGRLVPGTPQ